MVLFYRIKYIKNPNLNKIDEIATIRNQHLAIYSLLILQDGRLATGSDDFPIKIFNLENLECEQTLKGHMDGIICLAQLENGKLVSCSKDETIKIWQIMPFSSFCEVTIKVNVITKLISLKGNRIAICYKKKLNLINGNYPYNTIHDKNEQAQIESILQLEKTGKLVYCLANDEIHIVNLQNYQKESILLVMNHCSYPNGLLELKNGNIIIGGNNQLYLIHRFSLRVIREFTHDKLNHVFSMVQLNFKNVIIGCKDFICLFDIYTNNINVIVEKIHNSNIFCLIELIDNVIVTGSKDTVIKLLEF